MNSFRSAEMKFRKVFVTVGTTEFNELIAKISELEVYEILKNQLKCDQISVQIGRGVELKFDNYKEIDVEIFSLKDSITNDIESADLVSSCV